MGQKIPAPVWYDGNDAFLGGLLMAVDSEAQVIGPVQKPTGHSVPPFSTTGVQNTLYVKDPVLGGLFLNLTLDQWQAAIRKATVSPAPALMTKTYTIPPSGAGTSTITDTALTNVTFTEIWLNGIALDIGTVTYAGDTLTFPSPFGSGDVVGVVFYNN